MADELAWIHRATLRRPILVVALSGLFDAADAATDAVQRLGARYGREPLASIDPESYFDFTQERPTVRLGADGRRHIDWPTNEFGAVVTDAEHDLVLLSGVEPHLRWQTFCSNLLGVADESGCEMVVTLGAMVGMAPHTRPLGVVGSTTNVDLGRRLGLGSPSYEGPTGVIGVLHDTLDRAGMPVISLRVSVPHYVPSPPNPEATRSLLARFELVTGIETPHATMAGAAADWRQHVDAAVDDDEEMATYVQQLEARVDDSDTFLPTGDDLAAELEAFLREQRD